MESPSDDALAEAVHTAFAVATVYRRLALWFAEDDPVYLAYAAVQESVKSRVDHLMQVSERIEEPASDPDSSDHTVATDDELMRDTELGRSSRRAFDNFAKIARTELEPKPTGP